MADSAVDYRSRRVLVTGAGGFIGERLCRRLGALGAEVHGVGRRAAPAGWGAAWHPADLTDEGAVGALFRGISPEVVFHLAGFVSGRRGLDAVWPALSGNLLAAVTVMWHAQTAGCRRVVLSGSMEEPREWPPEAVPASPYAAAKMAATLYARMFHALYRLPAVIARIFMVYGPGQKDLTKLVPYVILSALRGQAPELSSGVRRADWVFVDDVVEALLLLGCLDGLEGQTLDIGTGVAHSVREVAETLCDIVGNAPRPKFGALADRPFEQENVARVDDTLARTGWKAVTPLRGGLEATVGWYRTGGDPR